MPIAQGIQQMLLYTSGRGQLFTDDAAQRLKAQGHHVLFSFGEPLGHLVR